MNRQPTAHPRILRRYTHELPASRGGGTVQAKAASPAAPAPDATEVQDVRCDCHRLLARAEADGLVLRCPRCKTDQRLTWAALEAVRAGGTVRLTR